MPQEGPTEICVNNKSTIALSKNLVFRDWSKYLDTCYYYIKEYITRKEVQVEYVKSKDQSADIFTKPLKYKDFAKIINLLEVIKQVLEEGVLDHKLVFYPSPKIKPSPFHKSF